MPLDNRKDACEQAQQTKTCVLTELLPLCVYIYELYHAIHTLSHTHMAGNVNCFWRALSGLSLPHKDMLSVVFKIFCLLSLLPVSVPLSLPLPSPIVHVRCLHGA